jgi:hypothetical protein
VAAEEVVEEVATVAVEAMEEEEEVYTLILIE